MYTNNTEKLSHRELQDRLGISFPRNSPPEGWTIYEAPPPTEPTLDEVKQRATRQVDSAADAKRKEYITDVLGQPVVYRQKYEEALEYRADDSVIGPYLKAESERRGMTVDELADEIEQTRDEWRTIDAQIEAERVGGKQDVRDATDVAGVEAARDSAVAAIDIL